MERKVRYLLLNEKLKKGAVKGREQAAEDFENQRCRLGDRSGMRAKKTPSLHRLGGRCTTGIYTLFRGLNPRFFLGLDIKNVWRLMSQKCRITSGYERKNGPIWRQ
jgi:hypothetical protein